MSEGIQIVIQSSLWVFQIGALTVNFGIGTVYAALPVLSHYFNQPVYYGMFLSAISLGMVLSTLAVNYVKRFPFGKIMVTTFMVSGLLLMAGFLVNVNIFIVLFGMSWLSVGLSNILFLSAGQSILPGHLLGRITSIMSSISVLGVPLGSLIGGILLEVINPIAVISMTGVCFIMLSMIWLLNPRLFKLKPINQLTLKDFNLEIHT